MMSLDLVFVEPVGRVALVVVLGEREPPTCRRRPSGMGTLRVVSSAIANRVARTRGRCVGGMATVAMCVCMVGVTGCQSADSSAIPPDPALRAAPVALCARVSELSRLDVQRRDAFPQNHIRFSFPGHVVVATPRRVQATAEALCELKPFPSGAIACPNDRGIVYHLTFQGGVDAYRAAVSPTGCPSASGDLGKTRWVTSQLWRTLGTAMNLPKPTQQSFAGAAPWEKAH